VYLPSLHIFSKRGLKRHPKARGKQKSNLMSTTLFASKRSLSGTWGDPGSTPKRTPKVSFCPLWVRGAFWASQNWIGQDILSDPAFGSTLFGSCSQLCKISRLRHRHLAISVAIWYCLWSHWVTLGRPKPGSDRIFCPIQLWVRHCLDVVLNFGRFRAFGVGCRKHRVCTYLRWVPKWAPRRPQGRPETASY
jgi:hypothetical protein